MRQMLCFLSLRLRSSSQRRHLIGVVLFLLVIMTATVAAAAVGVVAVVADHLFEAAAVAVAFVVR